MKKNVIISLADANYFELLDELVNSIKRFRESANTAICILDAGLTDEQKQKLSSKVDEIKSADWDIEVPSFKVKGREWLKSQVSRAFLPKYFPGYEKYLWIDADAWVNSWGAIELYFKGCENNKLSIATSADRAYGRVLRAEWVFGSFAKIKSQNYKHAKSSGFSDYADHKQGHTSIYPNRTTLSLLSYYSRTNLCGRQHTLCKEKQRALRNLARGSLTTKAKIGIISLRIG